MSAEFPIEYNTRHVEAFLHKIIRHRDLELQQIDKLVQREVGRIRQQAHAQARQLARRVVSETRERERRRRDRYLYKLRSQLTRERWGILEEIQERVLRDLRVRYARAWTDPDRQYAWCRFWVESAMALGTPNDLRICCGAGTTEPTLKKIRRLPSSYPGQCEWRIDADASPGLVVEWPDHHLDGTLDRQCGIVAETVLSRVAEMLDINGSVETNDDQ